MASELFKNCLNDQENYANLDTKQKRNLIRNIEDLLEDNFEEGKKLFINYFELFDLDSKFESLKELFIEKYGDITQLRKDILIPKYISKLNELIKNELSSEKENEFKKIFNLIIITSPEEAFDLYEKNESRFGLNPNLKNLITSNWNILKKYDKPFEIGKDFYPIYKVRNYQFYHKKGYINKEYVHWISFLWMMRGNP